MLAEEYGKLCTVPPTAHLISIPWKKKILQDLQGKGWLFHFKMVLFPSDV